MFPAVSRDFFKVFRGFFEGFGGLERLFGGGDATGHGSRPVSSFVCLRKPHLTSNQVPRWASSPKIPFMQLLDGPKAT